jgi:protein phosphatase
MRGDVVLDIVAQTDVGKVRSNNEDSVLVNAARGIVALADGMGGYNAGEVASSMATSMMGQWLENSIVKREAGGTLAAALSSTHAALDSGIAETNRAIFLAAQSQAQYAGMGTTLVIGIFQGDTLTVAHIGDSRAYRLRDNELIQITRDHSWLEEKIASGLLTREQAQLSRNKNLVTRAVGIDAQVTAEIHDFKVMTGDVYLFCSDGLTDMVSDKEIGMTLNALSANLNLCALQLIQLANDNGGRDNVSVILVKVKKMVASPFAFNWWQRFLTWFKSCGVMKE